MRALGEGRIGHGLMMAGPGGVGKHAFALALAQALNCERPLQGDSCGECLPCRKIAGGEHSDVLTITPDGASIKIGQMREMSREAQFRPYEGRWKVIIIDEADRLREEAANSILKTLEEPPATTLIVLVTSKPYALLETIRSRCQMLRFAPLADHDIEAHLVKAGRKKEEARVVSRLARGSIGRALEIDLAKYRSQRNVLLELLDALLVSRDTIRLINAAEYLGRKLEREEFEQHLDVLMVLLSDLFRLKLREGDDSLTNVDVVDRLKRAAEAATLDQIMTCAGRVEELWQSLSRNVNRRLATEAMLISM
jgi:DNA polymerase-3 subunit delta'